MEPRRQTVESWKGPLGQWLQIRITSMRKDPDPRHSKKSDPEPHLSGKPGPDQINADPQHCPKELIFQT